MLAGILAFPTLSLWLLSDSSIVPRERNALYSQATVPGIGLVGGSSSSATLDIERYTERGRQRAVKELVETWRTRLNNFGVSEPKITELEANLFNIIVPINMKSKLTKRIISEPGSITLHLFKNGIDVQKLRGRIDEILHEKYNLESVKSNMLENVSFSSLLSSISMEDGISDIVVKESNIADVKQILADPTVRETIRAFNLANPPAGEFVWASQSIERGGIKYYPLYFINQNLDLNVQPLSSIVVGDASVTADRGAYAVRLFLNDTGRESLANLSSANSGNRLAIKMNRQVYVTLGIQGRIPDGRIEIPGGETLEEARALGVILETEFPPLGVTVTQATENTASAEEDHVLEGSISAIFGGLGLASILFLVRYRVSGIAFIVGIIYQIIMTLAILRLWKIAGLDPYLTLAGLAGYLGGVLVFTAVHCWLFEYLRTELQEGSSVRQVVLETLTKAKPVLVWAHTILLLISVCLIVAGIEGMVNYGLVLFSGVAGSLLTYSLLTHMLLSSSVTEWQLKKLSV